MELLDHNPQPGVPSARLANTIILGILTTLRSNAMPKLLKA